MPDVNGTCVQPPVHERSGVLAILGDTGCEFAKRFFLLFPLSFLSVFFFLLIGILISRLSLPWFFPDLYPANRTLAVLAAGEALLCLGVSLYTQAAFLFAVSGPDIRAGDALTKALYRLASYSALVLIMAFLIGVGLSLLVMPGIIAAVFLAFAPFVFAAENAGVADAISRSIGYIARDWLRIFLTLIPIPLFGILMLFLFTYGGAAILVKSRNPYLFVFIISGLFGVSITLLSLYVRGIYDDLRKSLGALPDGSPALPLARPGIDDSVHNPEIGDGEWN